MQTLYTSSDIQLNSYLSDNALVFEIILELEVTYVSM